MADLNEQDLLDYDEEEQEVKDIKAKKDVKVIYSITWCRQRASNYLRVRTFPFIHLVSEIFCSILNSSRLLLTVVLNIPPR